MLSPVAPVVEELPSKLKQYSKSEFKSELANVTECSETPVAFNPIPGHGVVPAGRFDTLVVQLATSADKEKSLGKVMVIESSLSAPADEGWAQTVPESGEDDFWLSSLK